MSKKVRMNTRKHLHAARLRALREAKAERVVTESSFRYSHEAEMRKMLKGVDRDRYEFLSRG